VNQVTNGVASFEVSEIDAPYNNEDQPLYRQDSAKKEQEAGSKRVQEYAIEYYVINLMKMKKAKEEAPQYLEEVKVKKGVSEQIEYTVQERKEVTDVLINLAEKDQSVLEIETLQIIIEFKWTRYTQLFFTI